MTPSRLLLLNGNWHPRRLFRNGELGTVQNPSNAQALYQDAAGATPGAVGSLLGRLLDETFSLDRGAELWADASIAAIGESSRVSAGVYRIFSSAGANSGVQIANRLTVGNTYEATFTIDSIATAGSIAVEGVVSTAFTTTGAKRVIFEAFGTSLYVKRLSACDFQVSGISVKAIAGAHAIQTTAGSRPTLNAGNKVNFSSGTKSLVTTFPSSLGSSCTVARAIPQGEASILTGQTINTTFTDTVDHCGMAIVNRDLTATETGQLRRWLNRRGAAA